MTKIEDIRQELLVIRTSAKKIALVPTMGYLH
ncbi:MAG: pantoate--beta-alanine ligase, partial [Candidatus Marinimicrobia bacterium]|nr:pantoate--beta-alanine ligase [Candidatus Neomarinimicrobiota bacterium]